MLRCTLHALFISISLTPIGCSRPNPEEGNDIKPVECCEKIDVKTQLQGRWAVEEVLASDGVESPLADEDDLGGSLFFEFKENKLLPIESGNTDLDWEVYSLDTAQTPMWIDTYGLKGIFQIENDKLTICWGLFERPSSFDFTDRIMAERYTLRRIAPHDEK